MDNNKSQHVAEAGLWKGLHPAMGIASKGMVAAFVVFTALNVEFANSVYSAVRGWIESALNWYYISALVVMLFVCFYLMLSRFGSIKLGDDDSKPEFSNFSWFAMLFSVGVGIGLLFFGIAEPMFYFDNTQTGSEPAALLDSDAVVMTSVWNGRMYRPIGEDDKAFTILWDGQIWDINSWGIPKGNYNLDKALDFISFSTGSKPFAEQTKYISYGPTRRSAMALVSDQNKAYLPTAPDNMTHALQTDADWWAGHHEELTAEFEAWLAAGGRGLSGSAR